MSSYRLEVLSGSSRLPVTDVSGSFATLYISCQRKTEHVNDRTQMTN